MEAIIAFTAAIEIDPKRTPAYVGRGDAYVGQVSTLAAAQGADGNYNSAAADYLVAIDLEPLTVEAYEKLSRVYIEQGDFDAAADILERGYETTKDGKLSELLELLRIEINGPAAAALENLEMLRAKLEGPVTVTGHIIYNPDVYGNTWETYREQYQDELTGIRCVIHMLGIRFESEQRVISENGIEYIGETGVGSHNLSYDILESLVGCKVEFTGSFEFYGLAEITGPYPPNEYWTDTTYEYNPNGPWMFTVESYVIVE